MLNLPNYFKSFYETGIAYSPNWYGTLDYSPPATVLMYDDANGFCIGYMYSDLPQGVEALSEAEALEIVTNTDGELVYKGDKLLHRWDVEDGDIYRE